MMNSRETMRSFWKRSAGREERILLADMRGAIDEKG